MLSVDEVRVIPDPLERVEAAAELVRRSEERANRARSMRDAATIYALYQDEVGKLLKPNVVRSTLEYFDDFYDQVRTPQDAERNIFRKCIKR